MLWGWGYDKEWIIIHEYEQKINLKRNIHIYDKMDLKYVHVCENESNDSRRSG